MKFPLILASLALTAAAFGQAPAVVVTNRVADTSLLLRVGVGVASYEENVSIEPVDSEWSSALLELEGRMDIDLHALVLSFAGQTWASPDDQETWTGQGQLIQVNDMRAAGVEARAGVGPRLASTGKTRVQPLLVGGFRAQRFERENFVTDGKPSSLGTVQEDYALGFAGVSIELTHDAGADFKVGTRLEADYVFFNEAENSLFSPVIEGDGGTIFRAEGDISLRLGASTWLVLGVSVDHQELSGDSLGTLAYEDDRPSFNFVEWPDNILTRLSGTAAVRVGF